MLMVPVCLVLLCCGMIIVEPDVLPNYTQYAAWNSSLLLLSLAGIWYGSYLNERRDRFSWAMQRHQSGGYHPGGGGLKNDYDLQIFLG